MIRHRQQNIRIRPIIHNAPTEFNHLDVDSGSRRVAAVAGSKTALTSRRFARFAPIRSASLLVGPPCPGCLADNRQGNPFGDWVEHLAYRPRRNERQVTNQHRQTERGHPQRNDNESMEEDRQ